MSNFAINGRNLTNIINYDPTGGTWYIVMSNAQVGSHDWAGDNFAKLWLSEFNAITNLPTAYSALNELFNFTSVNNNLNADLDIETGHSFSGSNIDSTLRIGGSSPNNGKLNEIDIVREIYATKIY